MGMRLGWEATRSSTTLLLGAGEERDEDELGSALIIGSVCLAGQLCFRSSWSSSPPCKGLVPLGP